MERVDILLIHEFAHHYSSDHLTILSQDLLVSRDLNSDYSQMDIHTDLADQYLQKNTGVFNDIVSDYRLIVVDNINEEKNLYLVSNRAGNGRMYYCIIDSGILFSSDARFLLRIVPFQVNDVAIYAILKYGATPEPMTISENIAAVPAAHYLSFNVRNSKNQTIPFFQFEFPSDQNLAMDNFDELIQPAKSRLIKSAKFLWKYKPAILISGGIDSSLIVAMMSKLTNILKMNM